MRVPSIIGAEIKALRRKAGISQTRMGELIGFSRHAVSYWETKTGPLTRRQYRYGAPARMLKMLGVEVLPYFCRSTRAQGDGVLGGGASELTNTPARGGGLLPNDLQQEQLDRECERLKAKALEKQKRQRVLCGAKTRKGHPCRNKSEPGRRRCKFHGGLSTGPKSPEGKARIAEAQRRRWARYHASV